MILEQFDLEYSSRLLMVHEQLVLDHKLRPKSQKSILEHVEQAGDHVKKMQTVGTSTWATITWGIYFQKQQYGAIYIVWMMSVDV